MSRRHLDQSPHVSSVKAALTLDQECGGLVCVPNLHVLMLAVCVCVCLCV